MADESDEAMMELILLCIADEVGFEVTVDMVMEPMDTDSDADTGSEQLPNKPWQPSPQ